MSLVLVADDEPAVLEVLTEVVEDLGHQVVRAHDGREALHLARTQRPNLVVTDHMMPRLSGLDLCRAIREDETLRETPVILLSAALPPEAQEAYAYLAKPFELDDFEALVKRTLDAIEVGKGDRLLSAKKSESPTPPTDGRIGWLAHELKTPLAAAKMNLQLLERRIVQHRQPPDSAQFAVVARQLDSMEQMIGALLDSTRLSEGRLRISPIAGDLAERVQAVAAEWRDRQPEVVFDVELPSDPVRLTFDPGRITQVMNILLGNAVKHGFPARRVRVELARRPETVDLKVQDFGPGIPPDAQKTLFQPFGGSDAASGGGSGVGLYLASGIARLHEGTLSVSSRAGEGAVFTLSLPLAT